MSTHLLPGVCPCCGRTHDAATNALDNHKLPIPGDITVCIDCAAISIFDDQLVRRLPTAAEAGQLATDHRLARVQQHVRLAIRRRARNN